MKTVVFCLVVVLNLIFSNDSSAKDDGSRGAAYDLNDSVLGITEKSFKLIDRANDGKHAEQIVRGGISTMSVKMAVEKILANPHLFEEKFVVLSPTENLLIEFEGQVSNLIISNICRGKYGNYLAISIPDIYFMENFSVNISGQNKNIKQLIIGTDPSTGLVLQKKLLQESVGEYLRFFLKQMDSDRKFKVQGLINYAEQTSSETGIEKLELTITIIKISPIP